MWSRFKSSLTHRRLRFDIVSSFLVLFILSSFFVLFYTYTGTKKTSLYFAHQILQGISETTIEKTRKYIIDAKSSVTFSEGFFNLYQPNFLQDIKIRDSFMRILQLYPHFTVMQVALKNGDYLSVERAYPGTKFVTNQDKTLPENIKYLSQHQVRSIPGQQYEAWTYFDEDGNIVTQENNEFLIYDARKRPWYMYTDQRRRFNWSPIYVFSFSNIPGTTASIPLFQQIQGQENMVGVVGIDLSLVDLSEFLSENNISENGTSFILNADEQLVASSNQEHMTAQSLLSEDIITLDMVNDLNIKEAYKLYQENKQPLFEFDFQGETYMASFSKLDDEGQSHWTVGLVAPVNDFLVEAKKIRDQIFYVILVALLLSTYFIFVLSRRISKPIMAVADETQRLKNLDINGDFFLKSSIIEIQLMLQSIAAMRNSLKSFGKFVPKRLVHKLMQKGGEVKLGGRKKELTMFFSDIEGFTTISESMSSEKLIQHLSLYLDELSTIINENAGTIDKYIGDAIMAFWGAPLPDREHTAHACRTALLCQKRLVELNRQWQLEGKPMLNTRIGLHRAEVIVGVIGSQEKMNYTIMGDGVNTASRLEGINKDYGTNLLISESVEAAISEQFLCRPLDFIAVKGRKKPLKIFELVAQNKGDPALLPTQEQRELCLLSTKAFHLYSMQKWEETLTILNDILKYFPSDSPSKLLRERCKQFQKNPPPADWDGVTVFTHK